MQYDKRRYKNRTERKIKGMKRDKFDLDKAIKHAENCADYDAYGDEQLNKRKEYRQIYEWLKELRKLRKDYGANRYY